MVGSCAVNRARTSRSALVRSPTDFLLAWTLRGARRNAARPRTAGRAPKREALLRCARAILNVWPSGIDEAWSLKASGKGAGARPRADLLQDARAVEWAVEQGRCSSASRRQ